LTGPFLQPDEPHCQYLFGRFSGHALAAAIGGVNVLPRSAIAILSHFLMPAPDKALQAFWPGEVHYTVGVLDDNSRDCMKFAMVSTVGVNTVKSKTQQRRLFGTPPVGRISRVSNGQKCLQTQGNEIRHGCQIIHSSVTSAALTAPQAN
jgi:hypothetical protein